MELNILSQFWMLTSAVTALSHLLISSFGKNVPDIFKAAYKFGKLKIIDRIESKTPIPIPKRWFTHFYAFGVTVHSVVFTLLCLHLTDKFHFHLGLDLLNRLRYPTTVVTETNALPVVMVFTMEWIQMARRLYECLFTSSFSQGTMSPIHYFYGNFLYTSFGIGLLASVDVANLRFNFTNADLIYLVPAAVLFLLASFFQHKTFVTFASLRKVEKGKPAKGHYIPRGHLFEWVSCPHYLCEMIVYISLCLVFQMKSVYLNSVLSFVLVNQISSSLMAHDWYRRTFKNYPKRRKAVFPFVL